MIAPSSFSRSENPTGKVSCLFPMVVVSIQLHAEFGQNYHEKAHPTFVEKTYVSISVLFNDISGDINNVLIKKAKSSDVQDHLV